MTINESASIKFLKNIFMIFFFPFLISRGLDDPPKLRRDSTKDAAALRQARVRIFAAFNFFPPPAFFLFPPKQVQSPFQISNLESQISDYAQDT
jgi:hypothetical protein